MILINAKAKPFVDRVWRRMYVPLLLYLFVLATVMFFSKENVSSVFFLTFALFFWLFRVVSLEKVFISGFEIKNEEAVLQYAVFSQKKKAVIPLGCLKVDVLPLLRRPKVLKIRSGFDVVISCRIDLWDEKKLSNFLEALPMKAWGEINYNLEEALKEKEKREAV